MDAAVELGILDQDYKTSFCEDFMHRGLCTMSHGQLIPGAMLFTVVAKRSGYPERGALHACAGECARGIACKGAHDLSQLRIRAAIEQDRLPADFKTERCLAYDDKGECPRGAHTDASHDLSLGRECLPRPTEWTADICICLLQASSAHLHMAARSFAWRRQWPWAGCLQITSVTCALCGGTARPARMETAATRCMASRSSGVGSPARACQRMHLWLCKLLIAAML